ncbi:hypothetical protein ACVIW0_005696 [Bradyrhizobium sp. USDA 4454]
MGPEQKGRKLGGRTTGVTGAIRLSLRDGLRLIRALPGETWLCCHRLRDAHLRNPKRHLPLGRQACTTSPSASCAFVNCAIGVHRISTRVRDDREAPLVSGETGRFIHRVALRIKRNIFVTRACAVGQLSGTRAREAGTGGRAPSPLRGRVGERGTTRRELSEYRATVRKQLARMCSPSINSPGATPLPTLSRKGRGSPGSVLTSTPLPQ